MEILYSAIAYLFASKSFTTSFVISARNRPRMRLSCLMNTSLRRDCPHGLYFRLNRSNLWNVFLSACMSSVSTLRSYPLIPMDSNTSRRLRNFPSR